MRQRWVRFAAVGLVAGGLVSGCGGGADDTGRSDAQAAAKADKVTTAAAKTPAANPAEAHLAVAVADSKTSAPIDLLYDLPARPEVGQPFTVELTLKPRVAGDALDVEIGESPGVTVEGEPKTRFVDAASGEPYKFAFQARGDAEGLYYVTVNATLSNQVQSQSKSWSVPVVIGRPPAAEASSPQSDAGGKAGAPTTANK